ncbi:hypothetical protein NDU88_001793 [Pleurodeles waltl]|uniref:Uncharacterized protein n=1 Tax=Pleurodeles waltl TaxID=8319 RepID=A0AAV7UVC6_PLEWA|nr:hypothetical protein NDU88_001793 [Pleurodeles waltl]
MQWQCSWQSEGTPRAQDGCISIMDRGGTDRRQQSSSAENWDLAGRQEAVRIRIMPGHRASASLMETAANVGGREAREEKGKRWWVEKVGEKGKSEEERRGRKSRKRDAGGNERRSRNRVNRRDRIGGKER